MVLKRVFDIFASVIGIGLFWPIYLLLAVAVKLDSRGPVFFWQERMGRGFKPFQLIKFRTMVADAERQGTALTAGGDRRITRIGRFLRRTKVDELPQLFNVLVGEMSLVGPRPEVRKYVELFHKDYEEILAVRPGITDYAAIEFRDEEAVLAGYANPEEGYVRDVLPRKIALYREYLQRRGFFVDLGIIFKTLARIVA